MGVDLAHVPDALPGQEGFDLRDRRPQVGQDLLGLRRTIVCHLAHSSGSRVVRAPALTGRALRPPPLTVSRPTPVTRTPRPPTGSVVRMRPSTRTEGRRMLGGSLPRIAVA